MTKFLLDPVWLASDLQLYMRELIPATAILDTITFVYTPGGTSTVSYTYHNAAGDTLHGEASGCGLSDLLYNARRTRPRCTPRKTA
jgi:hypothetical protein